MITITKYIVIYNHVEYIFTNKEAALTFENKLKS